MIKSLKFHLIFTLIFISVLTAQNGQYITIKPEKPKIGDKISISYNSTAKDAVFKKVEEINLEAFLIEDAFNSDIKEIKMEKSGKKWTASFELNNKKAKLILFRFSSGGTIDDKFLNPWYKMVFADDQKPVENACYHLFRLYNAGTMHENEKKYTKENAQKALLKEKELYPFNIEASIILWNQMLHQQPGPETKSQIKSELLKFVDKYKEDESKIVMLWRWFEITDQKSLLDEIVFNAVRRNPKGPIAQNVSMKEIVSEEDQLKKRELLDKYLKDFPDLNARQREGALMDKFYCLVRTEKLDEAYEVIQSINSNSGSLYYQIALRSIENKKDLKKTLEWAKKSIECYEKAELSKIQSFLDRKLWIEAREDGLGNAFAVYAYGLFLIGQTKEAEEYFERAYKLCKGWGPTLNERYVQCLIRNENYRKAMNLSLKYLEQVKITDKMVEYYRNAYIKINGSDTGLDEKIDIIKNKKRDQIISKMKKRMIEKPAPDFSLKSLDGKSIKLSDLRGKIVVLDFWNTLNVSRSRYLNILQEFYNKNKNDRDIVVLAINTRENEKGVEREGNVKKFIQENNFTFSVLYDDDIISKYEAKLVPARYFIDKDGKIRFISERGIGIDQSLEELDIQLNILKGKI